MIYIVIFMSYITLVLGLVAGFILISALATASSFLCQMISGLHRFNLSAYGLPACCPTHDHRGYPLRPKNLLPGGWLIPSGTGLAPAKTRDLARPHYEDIIFVFSHVIAVSNREKISAA
jgi:hypothetical protein